MAHGHHHGPPHAVDPQGAAPADLADEPSRPVLASALAIIVAVIAAVTIVAMVILWPSESEVPQNQNPVSGEGVGIVGATVTDVQLFDCGSGGVGPDNRPTVDGDCAEVTAETDQGEASFTLDSSRTQAGIEAGDEIELIRIQPDGQEATFEFYDFQRGMPLTWLAIAFFVLVVAVARWRGLFAILGIGVTLLALTQFILPALLAGRSALPVAIVGSTAIMIVVLYLAHGISIRTTAALFGTFFGIVATASLGVAMTGWGSLTGIGSEDDQTLVATVPDLSMSGVVAATMVIAGLGVLNDVTVTQASAVWEMRALQPTANAAKLFTSAMRIGRDHIASSVYTLVFAYAGSAMTVLLLISAYQRPLAEMATTEELGQEIVRTLVGAIGLVLAVPVTTAIAVALAPPGREDSPAPEPTPATGRDPEDRSPRDPGPLPWEHDAPVSRHRAD